MGAQPYVGSREDRMIRPRGNTGSVEDRQRAQHKQGMFRRGQAGLYRKDTCYWVGGSTLGGSPDQMTKSIPESSAGMFNCSLWATCDQG